MENKQYRVFSYICLIALLIFGISCGKPDLRKEFISATGILLIYKNSQFLGNCTTVAYERNQNKYKFFTAAHCVSEYKPETSETVFQNVDLAIILEKQNGDRQIHHAKILAIGELKNFDDFVILEVETDKYIPIVSFGQFDPKFNENVAIVTSPVGVEFGSVFLKGYVSKEKINNKLVNNSGVNLQGAFGMQIIGLGSAQGTSGSGVFSLESNAVVGIVHGSIANERGHSTIIAIPIFKFNDFDKKYEFERVSPFVKSELRCTPD